MKWYYTDKNSTKMFCGLCFLDDEFSRITTTKFVSEMSQLVKCVNCGWCPKQDGLTRPESKGGNVSYQKKNIWSLT